MKIVAISDTHGRHRRLDFSNYLDCDTIIHAGDFTGGRDLDGKEFYDFINWLGETPFKNKILISGNHDSFMIHNRHEGLMLMKELGITYLEDTNVVIDGIKIHGSPWTPIFFNWYFMCTEKQLDLKYGLIDKDTDILITHGPAHGILDVSLYGNRNAGSFALRDIIDDGLKNLKCHIFGHIHEDSGILERNGVVHINASLDRKDEFYTFEVNK